MFTGLIESVGTVGEVVPAPAGRRMHVITPLSSELRPGDSVAVNGVCLTVVAADHASVTADVSPETLRITTLGRVESGVLVNLERPVRADARLGGHVVQGHVDATGTLQEVRPEGDSFWLTIAFPSTIASLIVRKGSIAVDGISLTVASVDGDRFGVQIVPFTWQHTNLHAARVGDPVNLECDILGKYVARALELGKS
jgi:riboflavin synthase